MLWRRCGCGGVKIKAEKDAEEAEMDIIGGRGPQFDRRVGGERGTEEKVQFKRVRSLWARWMDSMAATQREEP